MQVNILFGRVQNLGDSDYRELKKNQTEITLLLQPVPPSERQEYTWKQVI